MSIAVVSTADTNGNMVNSASANAAQALSSDEFALYDRQIRVWGAPAQELIRSAHVLLISLRALGTEIAKNLTLAGINTLTIVDDEPVSEEDLGAQYFLRVEDVGKPRAQASIPRIQELNPRVTVKSGGSLAELLEKDQTYYAPFTCVIACDQDYNTLLRLNPVVRFAGRAFYAAAIHGFYGFIFADLGSHEFVVEREKSNIATKVGRETVTRSVIGVSSKKEPSGKTTEIVEKHEDYCPFVLANTSLLPADVVGNRRKLKGVTPLLPCLRALFNFQQLNNQRYPDHSKADDLRSFASLASESAKELQIPFEKPGEFLRSFIQGVGAEIMPTAAFVGGRLSEDVINVIGQREQPIQNFAFFDGDSLEGKIYSLYTPELPLMPQAASNGFAPMPNAMHAPMMDPNMMMNLDGTAGLPMDMSMSMGNGFAMANGMMPSYDMAGVQGFAASTDMMNAMLPAENLQVNGAGQNTAQQPQPDNS